MDFQAQDSSNVKNLLAFLRTSQEKAAEGAVVENSSGDLGQASRTPAPATAAITVPPAVPTAKSLTELLASLQKRPASPAGAPAPASQPHARSSEPVPITSQAVAAPSASDNAPAETSTTAYVPFQAFGPIASQHHAPRRSAQSEPTTSSQIGAGVTPTFHHPARAPVSASTNSNVSASTSGQPPAPAPAPARAAPISSSSSLVERARAAAAQTPLASALKKRALEEDVQGPAAAVKGKSRATRAEMRGWSFAKALPVLSGLLEDANFVKEVKAMKAEQDALERKLLGQQEKLQSAHIQKGNNERTMASLARQPWTEAQEKAHKAELEAKVAPFHTLQVVPALDALASRHHAKLEELGVPGLGPPLAGAGGWQAVGTSREAGSDLETRKRVVKLMAVLEGVLADEA